LGHIERCKVLVHLIDGTEEDVAGAYRTVRAELKAYGHGLAKKPEILVLNKVDALTPEDAGARAAALTAAARKKPLLVSGVARNGIDTLLRRCAKTLTKGEPETAEAWEP
jgi:GTP-binding protein